MEKKLTNNLEAENSSEHLKRMFIKPESIITLNDFPVHSQEVLKGYHRMCQKGLELPPVPVINISIVQSFLPGSLFEDFLKNHPDVEYFMLDGSHRTTAATLTHTPISAIVFNSDEDIMEAKEMLEKGELYGLSTKSTIKECIDTLVDHFSRKPQFQTVLEKTEKMIQEKAIPQYMIDLY